jgi:hypothetical protein
MPKTHQSMFKQGLPPVKPTKRLHVGSKKQRYSHNRHGVPLVEAARRLCIDQSNLFMALQKGQIPMIKRDGRTLVSDGALREYQARRNLKIIYRY